ncbi:tail assembly protein [Salmonella enterica]|uniref:Tail assembly protein n=2 Tax=Salmonella enterica I TaxID=59201 RepID=A0A5Y0S7E4_SALNE|nr:tail assembly protein [Salmonella enterica]EBH8949772.1 tail assembly protein [Salmonella enterica subsp. diarizonae serovar 48:i:z]EBR8261425.1 tail assembly protein [Salmonella enterica subsp. enterica serovar Cerro]EBR9319738.1 tail assembly protein [Salmonella enterica subsp. enterica serovar Panama]EBS4088524.1 tail assembly protein [Salmonella enterica subsp. enterica serovar Newport]EBW6040630.1 tail assembly protein [Salmonella enterica subsp. enterica serovar Oranienburg]EBW744579
MATANALTMAPPTMARVCLYGDLQRFGRRTDLSIKTAAEGVYALAMQIPGFRQRMSEGWYQVRIAGEDVSADNLTARLHEPLPPGAVIHIVPRMEGAKSGWTGILAGAALIAASFIPGLNVAVWAGAAATWSSLAFSLGVSMMLGGVAQMLAPQPKAPSMHSADNGKQNTYFSSLDNMVAQGNPLPVPYGEVMTGSRRISQELSTRDESSPDKVVHFGRKGFMGALGLTGKLEDKTNAILAAQGITKPRVVIR